jgi:O-antigen ligase
LPAERAARVSASGSIVPGVAAPPMWAEWWYYAQVFYAVMGVAIGLSVGFVGVGMLAILAVSSVLRMGRHALTVLLPLALPMVFGVSFLVVQILIFGESPTNENVRPMMTWMMSAVAIQCLALRRGFIHRAAMAIAVVGLSTLPFLTLYHGVGTRFGLSSGISIANPNDLAAWFGFCALYFAIVALEARRTSVRLLSAGAAIGFAFVVVLTVSRGPLFAVVLGLVVALRRVLKRGVFAVVPLIAAGGMVFALGVFDQSAALYESRGLVDSGRLAVWPLAIDRFVHAPLTGVGVSQVGTYVTKLNYEGTGESVELTPHNQFIFIALGAGAVPLVLFILYWVELGRAALRLERDGHEDAVLLVPLTVYVFLIGMQLNQPYMAPWSVVVLGAVSANGFVLKARQAVADRVRRGRTASIGHAAFGSTTRA